MEGILNEIVNERRRQDEKFGEQKHHPFVWVSILGEEFGEVSRAAIEANFLGYKNSGNWSNYRAELIQVAAVAVAMIEAYDKGRN